MLPKSARDYTGSRGTASRIMRLQSRPRPRKQRRAGPARAQPGHLSQPLRRQRRLDRRAASAPHRHPARAAPRRAAVRARSTHPAPAQRSCARCEPGRTNRWRSVMAVAPSTAGAPPRPDNRAKKRGVATGTIHRLLGSEHLRYTELQIQQRTSLISRNSPANPGRSSSVRLRAAAAIFCAAR